MAGVYVNTLTMEQYLALSRENQAQGVVKPEIRGNVNFKIKSQFMRELREDTFFENKDEDAHDHIDWVLSIVGLFNIPKGPIPEIRPTKALIVIQTMADHSQKWHDGSTSRNIKSSSSNDGLPALVGCQICEGPHLEKDCPLNEVVKQVEEVRYGEFGRTTPFNGSNGGKFRHQEESARRSTEMDVWIKKLKENAKINIRNQDTSLKNLETQIEQLTKELHSRKEKSEEAKDFKAWPSCKPFRSECDEGHEIYGIDELRETKYWFFPDNYKRKEMKGDGVSFPNFLLIRYDSCQVIDKSTKELDPDKVPFGRCYDKTIWLPKEIEQLVDEYVLKIREKGQALKEIWTKCKRARSKDKDWWYDYWYEDEEKTELVVSELVALRNFARRYGSRLSTHCGCIKGSYAQTGPTGKVKTINGDVQYTMPKWIERRSSITESNVRRESQLEMLKGG
ncbi:hypothetical protein Tco_0217078 [Tanacetum coccineum]